MRRLMCFLVPLGILIGCQADQPTDPGIETSYNVTLNALPDTIEAVAGFTIQIPVTGVVRTIDNAVAPSVAVEFIVRAGNGSFSPARGASDAAGNFAATLSITPLTGEQTISIEVTVLSGQASGTVFIRGFPRPTTAEFIDPVTRFIQPDFSVLSNVFEAGFRDQSGAAIAGLPVTVVLANQGGAVFGTISAPTRTDSNGVLEIVFSNGDGRGTETLTAYTRLIGMGDSIAASVQFEVVSLADAIGGITLTCDDSLAESPLDTAWETSILATVRDIDQNPLQDVPVSFSTDMGSITANAATDRDGVAIALFRREGASGLVNVSATIPGTRRGANTTLYLNSFGSIELTADDTLVRLPLDSTWRTQVYATIIDANEAPVAGIQVAFTTDLYQITPTATTDQNGVAKAHFYSGRQRGDALIRATIPGFSLSARLTIHILPYIPPGTIVLRTLRDRIYASVDSTELKVELKDSINRPIQMARVNFSSPHGIVPEWKSTSEQGVAYAKFRADVVPTDEHGNAIPAKIYATYQLLNLQDSISITVLPLPRVDEINLTSEQDQMFAGSGDTSTIRAVARLTNGAFAVHGTAIHFEIFDGCGSLTQTVMPVGDFGLAETGYIAGDTLGHVVLRAFVVNSDGIVFSDGVLIELIPASPQKIRLTLEPRELSVGEPEAFITATATLTDIFGNPITTETLVRFETSLGSITSAVNTDERGQAVARLISDGRSGYALVTAAIQTPDIGMFGSDAANYLLSDDASNSIQTANDFVYATGVAKFWGAPEAIILTADPPTIRESGRSGDTTSILTAFVIDERERGMEWPVPVVFELLNQPDPPEGCNLNGHGLIDSALTDSGFASIPLYSGSQFGPVLVRAYTWRDRARTDTVQIAREVVEVVRDLQVQQLTLISARQEMVAGSGDSSRCGVIARLHDGSLAQRGTIIHYEVLNQNGRFVPEFAPFIPGMASVHYIAGDQAGEAILRAWAPERRNGDSIIYSNEVRIALAPRVAQMGEISFDRVGSDAGRSYWRIPVWVALTDEEGEPVRNGVRVEFEVTGDSTSMDDGQTGNDVGLGSSPGVAYSLLRYHSVETFDSVTVTAQVVVGGEAIRSALRFPLPLQQGELRLNVEPQNWFWTRNRPNDSCLIRLYTVLYDGHQILMNNAPILFGAEAGRLYWRDQANRRYIPFFPDPARRITGLRDDHNNEQAGQATVYLRGCWSDFFPNEQVDNVEVEVIAEVEGWDVQAEAVRIGMDRP